MIRLAMMLALFLSLAVASVVQADTSPATAPATEQEAKAAVPAPEEAVRAPKNPIKSRWAPRQARRRGEIGPAVTPYPVIFSPTGIPSLPF